MIAAVGAKRGQLRFPFDFRSQIARAKGAIQVVDSTTAVRRGSETASGSETVALILEELLSRK